MLNMKIGASSTSRGGGSVCARRARVCMLSRGYVCRFLYRTYRLRLRLTYVTRFLHIFIMYTLIHDNHLNARCTCTVCPDCNRMHDDVTPIAKIIRLLTDYGTVVYSSEVSTVRLIESIRVRRGDKRSQHSALRSNRSSLGPTRELSLTRLSSQRARRTRSRRSRERTPPWWRCTESCLRSARRQ
jgi:hypothetical protein